MTGHGGWPLNVFLTPEQVPFYAGTYFPPQSRQGMPSWSQVIQAVYAAWEDRREEIRAGGARIAERLRGGAALQPSPEPFDERRAGRRGARPARGPRPRPRRIRRRAQVPARLGARVPDVPRRGRGAAPHPARDGERRHVRPGGRRLCPLLGRRPLAGPPLREDALRQRPAGPRLPARLAGDRRAAVPARVRGDPGVGPARAARPRGRLHVGAGRRLRGRGGQVLRLVARGAALGRRRGGGRVVRRLGERQLRGLEHPRARPGRAGRAGRVAPDAVRGPLAAGLAGAGRQAAGLVERADDLGARRGRRGARAAGLRRGRGASARPSCSTRCG